MSVSSIPFVRVYDTTLREGEQSPLATITPEVKLEVIGVLDELGVDVVEAGFPRAQPSDIEVYKKARERISSTELSGFARAVKGDIDMVVEAGADIVQVFIPGSDVQLKAMMGVTWDEAIEKLRASVDYASSR
nr:homoaconitate hydratase [Desulfurococcales archaeon]